MNGKNEMIFRGLKINFFINYSFKSFLLQAGAIKNKILIFPNIIKRFYRKPDFYKKQA